MAGLDVANNLFALARPKIPPLNFVAGSSQVSCHHVVVTCLNYGVLLAWYTQPFNHPLSHQRP